MTVMLKRTLYPYLSKLYEFPNFCHPGQEPLVNLQGLLTFTFFHLEEFLCAQNQDLQSHRQSNLYFFLSTLTALILCGLQT